MATETMKPPRLFAACIRHRMHGVVVVLGVGRIDGDERAHRASLRGPKASRALPPPPRPACRGGTRCGIECAWMAIRLTARSLLSEPSCSTTRAVGRPRRGARPASTATKSPSSRIECRAGRNGELLAQHFLVDRLEPPAAVGQLAEDPDHPLLGMVDDLDDAAAVADAVVFLGFLDMQQHAVADTGGFAGARLAWDVECGFSVPARAPLRPIRRAWR